jgi:hypothetical protein
MPRLSLILLATTLTAGAAQAADPTLPAFDPAAFATPKANPWFPMEIGGHAVIAGKDSETGDDETADDETDDDTAGATETDDDEAADDGATEDDGAPDEVTRIVVTGPGPMVLGVPTVQILDEEWVGGHVMERTFDLVATDSSGNVWYFGEDVTNFEYDAKGTLTDTSTDATWRAGENGALPGILVPGTPVVGLSLFIGQAPAAKEMAYWEVTAVDATVAGPAGNFTGVLQLRHGSTLEPDDREFKFYAPGVGLIREEDGLSPALDDPQFVGERQP